MTFAEIVAAVDDFAWGPVMLILLVGTGLYLSIRSGFLQFTRFGYAMRNTIGKIFKKQTAGKGEVTPFQAMTTALAGTVGTGNIAGVTGAIFIGGPGAVFWLWISALVGMVTKYSEVVLAVKYRERNAAGDWVGGPMYYIKNGLGKSWMWLAFVFAFFGMTASFGIGNTTQVDSIATAIGTAVSAFGGGEVSTTFRIIIGAVVALITAFVIIGGIKRIGAVTEKLVPFMAVIYIIAALIVVFANIGQIGTVLGAIFRGAFSPSAIAGGALGVGIMTTIQKGIARGVFSNEAGLGSAPIVLQRGRSRLRADRPRRHLGDGSCEAGRLRHLRGVHGLHRHLHAHVSRAASGPFRSGRHRRHRLGRQPRQRDGRAGVLRRLRRQACGRRDRGRSEPFRPLHDSQLGALRLPLRRVPVRQGGKTRHDDL